MWGLLILAMAAASLLALINFNGWGRVASLLATPADPAVQTFWLVGSVIESSVWTLACVVSTYVKNKTAQTSASWLSGGPFQCQSVPQAAPSFGQPRPISRLGRAGRPYRPYRPCCGIGCAARRNPTNLTLTLT